jgi:N,N'-diacetyllegionaminate synthase
MQIIAEIGVNHNGSLEIAKKLVRHAKDCGADIVKFQTFKAKNNISKFAELADYQKKNTGTDQSQLELVEQYELSDKEFIALYEYCEELEISFLSTAFDIEALEFLDQFNMPFIKIPSGEITNLFLLEEIGKRNKNVLLSTGMSNLEEVRNAINILINSGQDKNNITVLQCTSQYPAPDDSINLNAMLTMADEFNTKYGLSDHSIGITAPIIAISMGASIIEKHITYDKNADGPDHKASIDIDEFRKMVIEIKRVKNLLGSGIKSIHECEKNTKSIARKSLVASRDISKGDVLKVDDLNIKRPGNGISPLEIMKIVGAISKNNIFKDQVLKYDDLIINQD